MTDTNFDTLLQSGVHYGHLKSKWNPKMKPYIFLERNSVHIIDLNKTLAKLDQAAKAAKQLAKVGKKILFVGTKKQARSVLVKHLESTGMPYVTERWLGGMLTNFVTIRKTIKRIDAINIMFKDGTTKHMSKKEQLFLSREKNKLEKYLGSIQNLNRIPAAIFIVDTVKEHIALKEAKKLGIPIFAISDTNSDPEGIDFVIPGNDDAHKSIDCILNVIAKAINEGLEERNKEKTKKIN